MGQRLNREILRVFRVLLSEWTIPLHEWPALLEVAMYVLNTTERPQLGGLSPMAVMTGIIPETAAELAVWAGKQMAEIATQKVSANDVRKHTAKLMTWLDEVHQDVNVTRERRKAANAKAQSHGIVPAFAVGDYVMVSRKVGKLQAKWQGPYQIVGTAEGDYEETQSWLVVLVGKQGKPEKVHAARMQRYADAKLDVTHALIEMAQHDLDSFEIDHFVNLGPDDEGKLQVQCRWKGFDESHDTWEPAEQLFIDVPLKLQKYLQQFKDLLKKKIIALPQSFEHLFRSRFIQKNKQQKMRTVASGNNMHGVITGNTNPCLLRSIIGCA